MVDASLESICAYIGTALAGLGLLGNLLAARMFSTTKLQSYSSAVFLLGLALSDLVVMTVEVLDDVAEIVPNTTAGDLLYGHNDWRCRVTAFVYQTARTISSWLVVALSIEMCLVGSDPKRSKGVYIQSRAAYVTMAVCLISVAACFPFLVIAIATADNTCTSKYNLFYDTYKDPVINITVTGVVPMCFVIVSTAKYFISHGITRNGTIAATEDEIQAQEDYVKPQFSRVIVLITLVFVVTTMPNIAIETIHVIQKHKPTQQYSLSNGELDQFYLICRVLFMVNYTIKFYLCVLFEPACSGSLSELCHFGKMDNKTKYSSSEFEMPVTNPVRGYYTTTNRTWRRQSASEVKI